MADRRGQPLVVLNPDSGSIWRIALRIAAIFVGAVLVLALMLTLGPRLFPGQLRFHPGATAYALLALLAIRLALAVVLFARCYGATVPTRACDAGLSLRACARGTRALS